MCGICGFVGSEDEVLVRSMTRLLAHRGPDGEGVRVFPSETSPAALGHRRLSIIDLSERGAQPMSYSEGRYWITYNGELYNFRQLRGELERDGFRFRSECDTEVLLAMFARDGEAMLERLNGIFALAVWDTERKELFLARDRLGVKPLYYARHDRGLYFASEVKALLAALPPPSLRHDALVEFLTFLWVPDPNTLFDGVHKLPPGHCATYSDGRLRIRRYWDLDYDVDHGLTRDEYAERVRHVAQEAIRRQMVSDAPLGSFFSGGIDSSAIAATMKQTTDKVTSYTVGFTPEDLEHEIVPDDLQYARRLARELGLDYHERILQPEIVDLLPRLVWHMDEPVADPAAITTYLICAAASERLTVILSGMGGDEIFAGYPRHLAAQLGRLADVVPRPLRRALRQRPGSTLTLGRPGRMRGPRRNAMKFLRGIDQPPLDRYLTYSSYYRADELPQILSPELMGHLDGSDPFERHKEHAQRAAGAHWLNQLLYIDLKTFLPCLNLTYTDKMSMAASTEVRVPLIDDEMVALAARIPPSLKLRGPTRKYVFKQAMRGVLPEAVISRPKAGFGAPIRSWLVGELRPMVDELLAPETVAARGLLDPGAVQELVRQNNAGTADNALRIWALLVLELWQRTFLDRRAQAHAPVGHPS